MNSFKFCLRRAKKLNNKKYLVLVYVIFKDYRTARQLSKALHMKLTTVRKHLNQLKNEAEIDCKKNYWDNNDNYIKTKENVWYSESEWCEQRSILNGLFMTKKDYDEFKKSDVFKEYLSHGHKIPVIKGIEKARGF